MSLKAKLGDTWKEAKSLHVKVNGEWKDISKLYSKKDGAWFVVFSGGGAIIEFLDYPYAIPVMAGWEYSTDGKNWTTVEGETQYYDFSNMSVTTFSESNGVGAFTWSYQISGVTQLISGAPTNMRVYMNPLNAGDVVYDDTSYMTGTGVNIGNASWITTDESDGEIIKIEVLDDDGNVVQTSLSKFPEINEQPLPNNFTTGDWDLSNMTFGISQAFGGVWIHGITGSTPEFDSMYFYADDEEYLSHYPDGQHPSYQGSQGSDGINGTYLTGGLLWYNSTNRSITLLGTDGTPIARWSEVPDSPSLFSGYVKVKSELNLSNYYNVVEDRAIIGSRKDGNPLSSVMLYHNSVVNGDKGFVGATRVASGYVGLTLVDIYDENGNRSSASALSTARFETMTFSNGNYGYFCGGATDSSNNTSVTDMYDSYGNRTSGSSLGTSRLGGAGFKHGEYGFVAGGSNRHIEPTTYYSTVEKYDNAGNRSSASSLSVRRRSAVAFSLGNYAYLCGGFASSTQSTVDRIDTSGNRTTGTALSVARNAQSFVNGDKGYVCGGSGSSVVDVYDTDGNRTTGEALSVGRNLHTAFSLGGYGFVVGGSTTDASSTVDLYDVNGVRSSGTELKTGKYNIISFVVGAYGLVCGGQVLSDYSPSDTVDMYYNEQETLYKAKITITEGSTYTLNGQAGTASVSEVLTFDSKVSGTINYVAGDLTPSVQITVTDDGGNVIEGAEITIEVHGDWDFSEAYVNYKSGGTSTYVMVGGITGSTPEVSTLRIIFSEDSYGELTVSNNDPNFTGGGQLLTIVGSSITTSITSCDLELYDSKGNIVAKATGVIANYTPVMPI